MQSIVTTSTLVLVATLQRNTSVGGLLVTAQICGATSCINLRILQSVKGFASLSAGRALLSSSACCYSYRSYSLYVLLSLVVSSFILLSLTSGVLS